MSEHHEAITYDQSDPNGLYLGGILFITAVIIFIFFYFCTMYYRSMLSQELDAKQNVETAVSLSIQRDYEESFFKASPGATYTLDQAIYETVSDYRR